MESAPRLLRTFSLPTGCLILSRPKPHQRLRQVLDYQTPGEVGKAYEPHRRPHRRQSESCASPARTLPYDVWGAPYW